MNNEALIGSEWLTFPWVLCFVQVSILLTLAVAMNTWLLRRCPGIASTIGTVALTASVLLVVVTLAGVPRPFEMLIETATMTKEAGNLTSDAAAASAHSGVAIYELMSKAIWGPADLDDSAKNTLESSSNQLAWLLSVSWFMGLSLGFAVLRFIGGFVLITRLVGSSQLLVDSAANTLLDRVFSNLEPNVRTRRRYTIRTFMGQGSPFVSWLTGRTIFVPENFVDWAEDEKAASLAHEVSHLRRRDHMGRMVLELTRWSLWFHPVAWLLARQTCLAQELAADQLAIVSNTNAQRYRRALSRLAIRFDAECRHAPMLCVSISSSLIRRISMLKQIKSHRRPRPAVRQASFVLAIAICSIVSCWSVAAQTEQQEKAQDGEVVLASHVVPVKPFSQPISQPWNEIGNQPGYISLRVSKLIHHPDVKLIVPGLVAYLDSELLPKEQGAKASYGLELGNIERINSSLEFKLDPNTEAEHRSSMHFAGTGVSIQSKTEVDWPGLLNAIDFSSLVGDGSVITAEALKAAVVKNAVKGKGYAFNQSKELGAEAGPARKPSNVLTQLWSSIAGGDAAVMYRVVGEVVDDEGTAGDLDAAEADFQKAYLDLMAEVEAIGYGVEFSPDFSTSTFRVVMAPNPEVNLKQLRKKVKACQTAMILDVADETSEKMSLYTQQLEALEISVVEARGDKVAMVVVEGQCDLWQRSLMATFIATGEPANASTTED